MTHLDKVKELYKDHEAMPYISAERDLEAWLLTGKPVPKRNMVRLADGLLAGDIILLWRIAFGTFTNETPFSKYFEYSYGIDAAGHLQELIKQGYAYEETAFDSLNHIPASTKKALLKAKGVKGLSKMKVAELDQTLAQQFSEEELAQTFSVRGYALTDRGQEALASNQAVIDRHPKKKF